MDAEKVEKNPTMQARSSGPETTPRLRADIRIVLHTHRAQGFFNGSWKHGKMGLLQFAKVMSILWQAVKQDDPYAEWYLLKTYQAIHEAREKLKVIEKLLESSLNQIRGIEVSTSLSTHPVAHQLQFATPFGYMGAYLITDFDFVLRQVLLLEKMGIMTSQEDTSIKSLIQIIQEVFSLPRQWKHTGVTRLDIMEKNQKSEDVKVLLGELPESVLSKKIEFAFLPRSRGARHDD